MSTPNPNERLSYDGLALDPAAAGDDPMALLAQWVDEAAGKVDWEASAFTLATVRPDGAPDARVVLARGIHADGVEFFTNYESAKGEQLAAEPRAAAVFAWPTLQRSVRVRGAVGQLTPEESDAYFATRPRGSQLGAWASPQSQVVASREELDAAYARAEARFEGGDVERPPHWGGYRLVPDEVELWSGRRDRLHDRVLYVRDGAGWRRGRLAP